MTMTPKDKAALIEKMEAMKCGTDSGVPQSISGNAWDKAVDGCISIIRAFPESPIKDTPWPRPQDEDDSPIRKDAGCDFPESAPTCKLVEALEKIRTCAAVRMGSPTDKLEQIEKWATAALPALRPEGELPLAAAILRKIKETLDSPIFIDPVANCRNITKTLMEIEKLCQL